MKALDLAKVIINRVNQSGGQIDHLKLQKLLYYIQGYTLKEFNQPAFTEEILHWDHGPVVKTVYDSFSEHKYYPIPLNDDMVLETPAYALDNIIYIVLKACRNYSAKDLEAKTHDESPWMNTNRNEIIGKDEIRSYFIKENPLNIKSPIMAYDGDLEEYKKFSDHIIERDKDIFEALA